MGSSYIPGVRSKDILIAWKNLNESRAVAVSIELGNQLQSKTGI